MPAVRRLAVSGAAGRERSEGELYSRLINGLSKAKVVVNRKLLSEMAIHDKEAFAQLVKVAKENLK